MAVRFQNRHHQSEPLFSPQKTQNLASEMRLKTASLGRILSLLVAYIKFISRIEISLTEITIRIRDAYDEL